jgi:hypothetical protein
VNWSERFGPEWTTDLDALRRKEPDYDALAAKARAYAERRASEGHVEGVDAEKSGRASEGGDVAKNVNQAPSSAWRVYYDQMGRPYYHNATTGQTQWTPPTA